MPSIRPRSPPAALSAAGLALLLCNPSQAQTSRAPQADLPLACLIQPSQMADVGSPVIGVVQYLGVERGDRVRRGQVLAMLRAEVERASVEAIRSRAQSEGELRGAIAAHELALLRRDRARSLKDQAFVSQQALEQAEAELRVAAERVTQVREALHTATREVNASEAQLAQRIVRSPFDGVVVERYANLGERFEDKALFRIAATQTLRVDVVAPTALFGRFDIGHEASITPELRGGTVLKARVAQIDQVLDPASNTFRLRLDLPNEDGRLPAGVRCRIDLGLAPQPTVPPPGAGAAR